MALEGMDDIQKNLGAMVQKMHREAAAAAGETALFLENTSKAKAPFTDRTGNLRNSIRGVSGTVPDGYQMVLSANMTYAPFVELGTRRSRPYAFIWPTVAGSVGTALEIFKRHLSL